MLKIILVVCSVWLFMAFMTLRVWVWRSPPVQHRGHWCVEGWTDPDSCPYYKMESAALLSLLLWWFIVPVVTVRFLGRMAFRAIKAVALSMIPRPKAQIQSPTTDPYLATAMREVETMVSN